MERLRALLCSPCSLCRAKSGSDPVTETPGQSRTLFRRDAPLHPNADKERRRGSKLALLAVAAAAALLLTRLAFIGFAPFVHDEPAFLLAAYRQLESGHWATHSPLVGSGSLRYGPTPLWFFGLLQLLLGRSATTAITAVAAITCACQLALITVLHARAARPSRWALAAVLLVTASAPYEFFWSRLAWDLSTNLAPFLALALLATDPLGPAKGALLGVILGLAISAHPMVTPLVAAVVAVVTFSRIGSFTRKLATLTALALALLAVNIPWLHYIASAPDTTFAGQESVAFAFSAQRLLESFRPQSIWGLEYFFDNEWGAFSAAHSWAALPALHMVSLVGWTLTGCVGLCELLRHDALHPGVRRVAIVGVLCVIGYPVFFAKLQLPNHPHYQFPLVWLNVAGAAGLFYTRSVRLWPLKLLAVTLAGVNLAFLFAWGDFIATNTGTRGIHYGTPLTEQLAFVRAACARPSHTIRVLNHTSLFSKPLKQHFEAEPSCGAKVLALCPADDCGPGHADVSTLRLHYREPTGGALAWEVAPERRPP
jgi:hypothetical protein